MFVSIVVCTHSVDNLQNLVEAVDSLLNQTYENIEIVIVVDGNQELYERIVQAVSLKENMGVSIARNAGIKVAQGDVIAFFDDDAIAEKSWIQNLVYIYQKLDAISVGGKILPLWLPKKPDFFPEELGWMVGMTQKGFAGDKVTEVRNTFGSNMSFKREVFDKIGLFSEIYGVSRRRNSYMQGEEAEFSLRMKNKLGSGIIYNPEAIVYHKIPSSRVKPIILLRRAFYQGYSKALLRKLNPSSDVLSTEQTYIKDLFFKYTPRRIKGVASINAKCH